MLAVLPGPAANAQVVKKKNLLISAGGGASYGNISSSLPAYGAENAWGGNITFGFGYAFNANWGMGIRYDRLGYTSAFDTLDQARVSLLYLHGTYRPWQTDVHAVEIETGIGAATLSMRGLHERIPAEARAVAWNMSVRYLHTLHRSIVAFCALRGSGMGPAHLLRDDQDDPQNSPEPPTVRWTACWFNAGLAVRW